MKSKYRILISLSAALLMALLGALWFSGLAAQAASPSIPLLDPPWNANVRVDDDPGETNQERPAIAVGSDIVYAAWIDHRDSPTSTNLLSAYSTDDGQTWSRPCVRVNDEKSSVYAYYAPAMAAAGPLTVHLAWTGDIYGYTGVYYDRSTDGARSWGTDLLLSSPPTERPANSPDIAVYNVRNVYVVWSEMAALYLARSPDEGVTWITSTRPIITATYGVYDPALAVGVDGVLHLAWEESGANQQAVCYARSKDGGLNWVDRRCFGWLGAASQQADPDIAVDRSTNRVHLVWDDSTSGHHMVYHTASNDGGVTWNAPTQASTLAPAVEPAVTAQGGVVYVVWDQQTATGGDHDIYYNSSTDGGLSWGTPGRVNDDRSSRPQHHPAIASGSGVYAIWDDGRNIVQIIHHDIYATSLGKCPVPLESVVIEGDNTTTVGIPITLTALIRPVNATPPISYIWSPAPAAGQGTAQAVYYWHKAGTYVVSVKASNCGGEDIEDHIEIVVRTPPPPLPCVEGIVTYAATPLANVRVELIAGSDPEATPAQFTYTDNAGRYRFCNVTPGNYQLKRYGPSEEYVRWVASSLVVGRSNVIRNLDLPKRMRLLSPEDRAIVFTSIPTLTWQSLPEAGRYTLQLNRTRDWALIEHRSGLATTSYQVGVTLTWGTSYTWQIDAYTGTHWVGTTPNAFNFTVINFTPITFVLPPTTRIHDSLRIEDAPPGVVVNKLIGDSTGATSLNYVDVVANVWTTNPAAMDDVKVTLTVPDNMLGLPVNTWVRSSMGGTLTPVSYTNLGGGRYLVTTDLLPVLPCYTFCTYRRQIVWRFQIPHAILPQSLQLVSDVSLPGYMVTDGHSEATLRLVNFPSALIITNRKLLYDRYQSYQVNQLLQQLYTVAQGGPYNDQPLGVIYYVDRYSTQARDWNNASVNYTSEATANTVANAIDSLIEDWVEDATWSWSIHLPFSTTIPPAWQPEYLLIVGDDDIIPFYRYNDPSDDEGVRQRPACPSAHGWCVDSATNPAIHATDEDYFFTDNPYADLGGGTDWQTGDLELSVGRLVGASAADMLALLDSSLATDGSTGRAVMASVDGWELGLPESPACSGAEIHDVLNVPERLVARGFNVLNDAETPRTVDVLSYPDDWNSGFRSAANGGMDIFFIGGHNSYDHASIPGDDFSPDDTCAAATCLYHRFDDDHPLTFIVGCHGGLTVPAIDVPGGVDHDMVYDVVHEGGRAYIGATGFSYGSPGSLCATTWGERLLQHFFDGFLPAGSHSQSIGKALRQARDVYVFGFGDSDSLDRKTVTEFVLYGVPWQRLDYPGGTAQQLSSSARYGRGRAAFNVTAGATVHTDGSFRYTRAITLATASYTATQVITDSTTYDVLSIPGGAMALAPGLPLLPYVPGYTLTLPFSATVQGVTLTNRTCADAGTYEIPIIVAHPWTEGGTSFTTTTDINTFYPPDEDLVRWQQQGDQMLFTLFPIQHNPTTNATRFCSQMVFQVAYDAPLPLAVSGLVPQSDTLMPGQPVTVTTVVANVGDTLATFTATLRLEDSHGNGVGWQDSGPFSVAAGGEEELELEWDGLLDEGDYAMQLTLWWHGRALGTATGGVHVVGGALTGLEVPTTTVMPGQRAEFQAVFANYRTTQVTVTVSLTINDEEGHPVAELGPQTGQVDGQSQVSFPFSWEAVGIPAGGYIAIATAEVEGTSYGPLARPFAIAHNVYLPLVLRDYSG